MRRTKAVDNVAQLREVVDIGVHVVDGSHINLGLLRLTAQQAKGNAQHDTEGEVSSHSLM